MFIRKWIVRWINRSFDGVSLPWMKKDLDFYWCKMQLVLNKQDWQLPNNYASIIKFNDTKNIDKLL